VFLRGKKSIFRKTDVERCSVGESNGATDNAEELTRRIKAQEGIKLGIIHIQEEQAPVQQPAFGYL
jgi:hypothetical protein